MDYSPAGTDRLQLELSGLLENAAALTGAREGSLRRTLLKVSGGIIYAQRRTRVGSTRGKK